MLQIRPVTVSALSLLVALACGGDDPDDIGNGGRADSGPVSDGGPSDIDASLDLPDAAMNAAGPIITILSPTAPAAGDYSTAAILTQDRVTARCRAETNTDTGDRVDAATVRISATNGASSIEATAQPTGVADEFEAVLLLGDFGNGAISIRCTASDVSTEARENSEAIDTFLDLGPTVEILSPLEGSSYANQTDVVFTVTAAPVASDDSGGDVDVANVGLFVSGYEITDLTNSGGTYSATIVFASPEFDPTLDGPQTLSVRAPNTRSATAVERAESLVFNVDSEGPQISIISPLPGELVSGIISIAAEVTDPTGVEAQSVVATVGGANDVQMNLVSGSEYSGLFDSRVLGPTVFPNVIVRARDGAGNQSSAGYLIGLDNAPPIVSLDSPPLRESKLTNGLLECSLQFDPLGDDSVNDGQSVPQLFEIRARIEDLSNAGNQTSGIVVPLAHVDPQSVSLFLLDDENGALLVDTNGDGVCDDINPQLVPTSVPNSSSEVAVIDLALVASTGNSFFADDLAPTFADTNNAFCTAAGDTGAPNPVCVSTPLSRVIQTEVGDIDVVYGIPPAEGLQCMGNAVDALAMNIADGWACAAARGADTLANVNVSPPLRICIDSDLDGGDGCPAVDVVDLTGAPNCTGTYDPVTDTVDAATPCTVDLRFADDEVRRIDL